MYVRKDDLFSAQYIEHDGSYLTLQGDFKVKKGDWVLSNSAIGQYDVVSDEELKRDYIQVTSKTRVRGLRRLSPFEEQWYEEGYNALKRTEKEYIRSDELTSNKAL